MSLTAALIATAALGCSFRITRQIGVAACAALAFLYPPLAILIAAGVAIVFLIRWRSR